MGHRNIVQGIEICYRIMSVSYTHLDVYKRQALDVNVPVVAVVFTLVEEIVILLPFLSTEYPLMPKSKSDKTPLLSLIHI